MDEYYRKLEQEYAINQDPDLLEKIYQLRREANPNKTLGFMEPGEPEWELAWADFPSDPDPETGEDWQYVVSFRNTHYPNQPWTHEFRHRSLAGYDWQRARVVKQKLASPSWYPKSDPKLPGSTEPIRNPERFKTHLQKYLISKDANDATRFAEEYLRTIGLEPKTDIEQMNIAQYCLSEAPWWRGPAAPTSDLESYYEVETRRRRIWNWIWAHSNFRHRNREEAIIYVSDPATPPELGMTEETQRLLFPEIPAELIPIIDRAIKLGYQYLCFYV